MKGRYQGLEKVERSKTDSAKWQERHTALMDKLRVEYQAKSKHILTEGQTSWKIEGKRSGAIVAGKMDLVTFQPNLVIDAKSGKPKDSHILQVKIYLLAISLGCVPNVKGQFRGVLRYVDASPVEVPGIDDAFKLRFFNLVRLLTEGPDPQPVPSKFECQYCDVAECQVRFNKDAPDPATVMTDEF